MLTITPPTLGKKPILKLIDLKQDEDFIAKIESDDIEKL